MSWLKKIQANAVHKEVQKKKERRHSSPNLNVVQAKIICRSFAG
jgi:hypothetical protein